MFRKLVLSACLIGAVLGMAMTAMQSVGVTPLLLAAERHEIGDPPHAEADGHHGHSHAGQAGHHGDSAWAPAEGAERLAYTAASNVFAGIGFTAILLVVMNQLRERGRLKMTARHGVMMGGLCYLAVFVAPSLGLPPEIPGAAAAALESRQLWWLATVVLAAAGLGLLVLARGWKRGIGLPLLLVPHAWVPAHQGPRFSHPDPQAVAALTELQHEFILASGLTNLAFWLLAGLLSILALRRLTDTAHGHDDVPG